MTKIKIYEMNDIDWVAATSLKEARDEYKTTYDLDDIETEEQTNCARELTDDELDKLKLLPDPYNRPNDGPSFRAKLAEMVASGEKFPQMFATTEF